MEAGQVTILTNDEINQNVKKLLCEALARIIYESDGFQNALLSYQNSNLT